HLHEDDWLVLIVAQYGGHRHYHRVALRAGVDHRIHEHVLLENAPGIARHHAHRRGARIGVHEGADIGNGPLKAAAQRWIGFLDGIADTHRGQVAVEDV